MSLEAIRSRLLGLNREQIEAIQSERLQRLLTEVLETNRFWKSALADVDVAYIEASSDLRKLPVMTKAQLVEDHANNGPYGSNLTYPMIRYARMHQTSGTKGRPMRWLDTPQSWDWFMECWSQIYALAGLQSDDRLFFPFSFGPFIGFWAAFEGANRLGNLCMAGGGMTSEARLQAIQENSATVICCTPTYALRLIDVAAREDIGIANGSVRMLIVAGEPGGLVPGIRKRIEDGWGARVIDHWGMTEIGSLAVESEDQPDSLVVLETECIPEIVNPDTLEPVADGDEGELLITNLGRLGSPLIRYRTGDLVRAGESRTGCEMLCLAGGILGRADDMFTVRGNNVFPTSIEAVVREFTDIAEFRIDVLTRRAMHHVTIEIEPRSGAEERMVEVATQLQASIKNRLNFQAEINLAESGSLPRFELKGRRYFRRFEDDL